jgi:protein-S-isoprenylcysteine O-methyltransferase Ste14
MERQPITPPTCLFVAVLLMVALHLACPLAGVVAPPWTLAGVAPVLVGLAVNVWASAIFGKTRTTIKPSEQSTHLVVDGPFRFSRHPMYAGMVLVLAGVAVMLGTVAPFAVIPAFVWLMQVRFVRPEERSMEETFGQAYTEYKKRVRQWI